MFEKILTRIFRYLVYLSLLTPFLVSKDFLFPFVTTKALFLRVVVGLALSIYIYLILAHREYRPNLKNPLNFSIIAFWLINLISAFFGVNVTKSLWGNFERMGGVYYLFHLSLIYFYILLLAEIKPKFLNTFLKLAVIIAGLASFYGILVALGMKPFVPDPSLPRISITFGNPIYVGSFLILPMFLSMFFVFQAESKLEKIIFAFLALLQLIAIYLSGTRGSVVGLVIGLFLAGIVFVVLVRNKKVKYLGGSLILFFVLIAGLLYIYNQKLPQGSILRRVFSLNDSNAQSRFIQWKVALRGVKDYSILGTGPENYYIVANKYHNPEIAKYDRSWFDKPHNFLLEILLTTGFLGFFAYFAILVFALWGIIKAYRENWLALLEFLALATGLVVYQLQNLFVFDNVSSSLMFYIYLAFCYFLWQQSQIKTKKDKVPRTLLPKSFLYTTFAIACLVSIYISYITNIIPARIAKNVNYGFAYASVDPYKSRGYFETALTLPFNLDFGETVMKFDDFAVGTINSPEGQKNPEFAKQNVYKALEVSQKLVSKIDNYSIYWYKLANVYLAKNVIEKTNFSLEGEEALQKAIDLAPKRIEGYMLKAQIRWMQLRPEEALEIINKVLELDPTNLNAKWQMALMKKELNREPESLAIFEELAAKDYEFRSLNEVQWVIDYYKNQKQYDKAIAIYERLAQKGVLQLDGYWALAKLYAEAGQKDKALDLASKILKADPSRKQEILDFFKGIK